jgi:hypothetical protein
MTDQFSTTTVTEILRRSSTTHLDPSDATAAVVLRSEGPSRRTSSDVSYTWTNNNSTTRSS